MGSVTAVATGLLVFVMGVADLPDRALPANQQIQPGDFIVDTEGPECPNGGPIFRITPSGQISVIAQGGLIQKPRGNAVDAADNLIVADGFGGQGGGGLLKVSLQTGAVSKIAAAPPFQPRDVVIDPQGNYVVVDWPEGAPTRGGQRGAPPGPPAVYRITPAGLVTLISQGGLLVGPHGVDLDAAGNIIVADGMAGVIRVSPTGEQTMVLAPGRNSPLGGAVDLRVDADGSYVVADGPRAALIRVTSDGSVSSIYRGAPFSIGRRSTNPSATAGVGGPRGVVIDPNGDYIVVDEDSNALVRVTTSGEASAIYSGPPLCQPADVTIFRPPALAPRPAPQPEVAPEPEAGPTDGAPPTEESGE